VSKLTIGWVPAAAGVNVDTIRYYQRRGLLEEPAKLLGGYRNYPKHRTAYRSFFHRVGSETRGPSRFMIKTCRTIDL
jgi:MerR family transcriptional regulator, mercuric resistance operon regulatory protein